jgi:hypothetical protein
MLDMLKRHEIQVLRKAGHNATEVAALASRLPNSLMRFAIPSTLRPMVVTRLHREIESLTRRQT